MKSDFSDSKYLGCYDKFFWLLSAYLIPFLFAQNICKYKKYIKIHTNLWKCSLTGTNLNRKEADLTVCCEMCFNKKINQNADTNRGIRTGSKAGWVDVWKTLFFFFKHKSSTRMFFCGNQILITHSEAVVQKGIHTHIYISFLQSKRESKAEAKNNQQEENLPN